MYFIQGQESLPERFDLRIECSRVMIIHDMAIRIAGYWVIKMIEKSGKQHRFQILNEL